MIFLHSIRDMQRITTSVIQVRHGQNMKMRQKFPVESAWYEMTEYDPGEHFILIDGLRKKG